jgi:hypothetical protein
LKVIIKYFADFFKSLNWFYYATVTSVVALLIYLNYWHGLEKQFIASGNWGEQFLKYFLLFFSAYAVAFFIQLLFNRSINWHKQKWFWIILFAGPLLFAWKVNFNFFNDRIKSNWTFPYYDVYHYSINWIVRVLAILLPVIAIWWIKDKNDQPFYGIKKTQSFSPYFLMITILLPLIIAASTQPDFLQMYPKAKNISEVPIRSFKDYFYYLFFELSYGFDFVSIEFFFRGFLILSLIKICGKDAIIPMAAFYCTIHFGKPLGEAISSYFGGMLLGIVAYHTRSIWGGLIVHLGIAWLMELGGWLGNSFFHS